MNEDKFDDAWKEWQRGYTPEDLACRKITSLDLRTFRGGYKQGIIDNESKDDYTKERIRELMYDEESGFWHSCSGCTELSDGHNSNGYPHSNVFNCLVGGGCCECGGIGVIWDNIDYKNIGHDYE